MPTEGSRATGKGSSGMASIPVQGSVRPARRPWVAWGLIAVNVVVYFVVEAGTAGAARDSAVNAYGLSPAVLTGTDASRSAVPDALTLVTYSFLHADFWHLAANMAFLWALAGDVEDALGHWRFLAFYLLCAVGAGVVFVLANPAMAGPLIGASGAIAGTISAHLLLHPHVAIWARAGGRIPVRLSAAHALGLWIVFQVAALVFAPRSNVAWWSHIGGLACGALLALVMRPRDTPLLPRTPVDDAAMRPIGSPPTQEFRGRENEDPGCRQAGGRYQRQGAGEG